MIDHNMVTVDDPPIFLRCTADILRALGIGSHRLFDKQMLARPQHIQGDLIARFRLDNHGKSIYFRIIQIFLIIQSILGHIQINLTGFVQTLLP